ncbi:hypothetical protein AB0D10_18675 [Kitasatospora sp. NPDC048545]|uniref:hypothetical protein n=1 Tax=Kitasatospora sp. NPDC048545 TaxID=3157208 RepID=UPI0033E7D27A
MGEAVGSMPAVAVALCPLPVITVIHILGTPRGRTNGLALTAGRWSASPAAGVRHPGGRRPAADGAPRPDHAPWSS